MYDASLKNCSRTHSGPAPSVEGAHAWGASPHSPLSTGDPSSSPHPHPSALATERLAASALQSEEHLAAMA
eukprot:scaffold126443_cov54-Phaeocystis_antarctica.AAC.2